jgi:tRNA (guanine37-N1)-methyltransferase
MRIDVITLFPGLFDSPLKAGLLGKALESGTTSINFIDPRAYTHDRHRSVDDTPYGGGGGMLMRVEPLAASIDEAKKHGVGPVIILSPQGRPLRQSDLATWAKGQHLVLVCGRYEGIDDRLSLLADEEISAGDFVLTGGEYAALSIIDGVVRLLPGTLGNAGSHASDSFSEGLLEGPQYTRPPEWRGRAVPELFQGGNHKKIQQEHRREAVKRTRLRRPDLLSEVAFDKDDRAALLSSGTAVPKIIVALAAEDPATFGEVSRVARAYGVEDVIATRELEEMKVRKKTIIASALPFALKHSAPVLGPRALVARAKAEGARIVLALGAGYFEDKRLHPGIDLLLTSVRPGARSNDLSLVATASILLERLVGEG